jgi:hypothetical protein
MLIMEIRLIDLFNGGILDEADLGKLLSNGIETISEMNIDEIVEEELIAEEKIEEIYKKFDQVEKEKKNSLVQEYLERAAKEPVETHTDKQGNFAGYRYSFKETVGSAEYHDCHVRLSTKEGFDYYGSLWYTNNGRTNRVNFEVDSKGNVTHNQRLGRFYRDVLALTEKYVQIFEEQVIAKEQGNPQTESVEEPKLEVNNLDVEGALSSVIG